MSQATYNGKLYFINKIAFQAAWKVHREDGSEVGVRGRYFASAKAAHAAAKKDSLR